MAKSSAKASASHHASDVYCDFNCALSVRKVRSATRGKVSAKQKSKGRGDGK